MKTRAWIALLALALLLVQAVVATLLPEPMRPDLLLVLALALGLGGGRTFGLLLAFGVGLAVDVLSGAPPGLYALLRGTACAATRALDGALYLRASGPWGIYAGVYAAVDLVALGVLLHWLTPEAAPPWTEVALRIPGSALGTALLAPGLLWVYRRVDREPGHELGLGFLAPGSRL